MPILTQVSDKMQEILHIKAYEAAVNSGFILNPTYKALYNITLHNYVGKFT
ncbi:MAG: hypothetical protein OXD54_01520 [Candidatus Poribacteria bacterium]|nr:hypothetical protein [Candidatus Poribacteria bacterium]